MPKALRAVYFLALMLTAIAMALALAHFFELPNKIAISAEHYLIVQRNYDNWSIIGTVVPLAFLTVAALTFMLRGSGPSFAPGSWFFGALSFRSIKRPRIGPSCRRIGTRSVTNGNTPTRSGPSSTFLRSVVLLCRFSTGPPGHCGHPANRKAAIDKRGESAWDVMI